MDDNKKIEYGIDHQDDKEIYRTVYVNQVATRYDGKQDKVVVTTKKARNRIIDLSIPEGQEGRVTYTPWKTVE